jgi:hypothetical protein
MYLFAYRRCVGRGFPLHVFLGGPSKWHQPLPAGVWLHTLLSFPPFFCGVPSGPVCPFQCQALERWLELFPSRGCVAHSAGKRAFASCAKHHLLQLDASSRLLDAAAFNRCLLSWHPGDVRFRRFGRRFCRSDLWRTFLVLFHKWMSASLSDVLCLGNWSNASTYFRFYHAVLGIL